MPSLRFTVVQVFYIDMYNFFCIFRHIRVGGVRLNIMVIILTTTNAYLPIIFALVNSAEKYNIPTPIGTDILCWVRTGICIIRIELHVWQSIMLRTLFIFCVTWERHWLLSHCSGLYITSILFYGHKYCVTLNSLVQLIGWSARIGNVLILSTLLAKNYRIYRVFHSSVLRSNQVNMCK